MSDSDSDIVFTPWVVGLWVVPAVFCLFCIGLDLRRLWKAKVGEKVYTISGLSKYHTVERDEVTYSTLLGNLLLSVLPVVSLVYVVLIVGTLIEQMDRPIFPNPED